MTAYDPHDWDDGCWGQVEDLEGRLKELKTRLPLLVAAVQDREVFLRSSGMPGKAQQYAELLATDLFLNLANVLEAYNMSPFERPDLPVAMARSVEEARAIQEARLAIADYMRYPLEPFNIKAFLRDDEPKDNAPRLGGDRKPK